MENLPLQLTAAIRHPLYIKCSRKCYASYSNSVEKSCPNGTKIWSVRNGWISPTRNRKEKKNQIYVLYACRYIFHHQELQCCSVVTLLQDHFSRFVKHMNIKKEKALKKANSSCSESVVLKVSSVVSQEFLWNTRNLFVNGNSTLHSKSISFYIFDNVHLLKQLQKNTTLTTNKIQFITAMFNGGFWCLEQKQNSLTEGTQENFQDLWILEFKEKQQVWTCVNWMFPLFFMNFSISEGKQCSSLPRKIQQQCCFF